MCAMLMDERELTLEEVAEQLQVSYWTARRRCLRGQIPYRKEGNQIRVRPKDLRTYIRGTYQGSHPEDLEPLRRGA